MELPRAIQVPVVFLASGALLSTSVVSTQVGKFDGLAGVVLRTLSLVDLPESRARGQQIPSVVILRLLQRILLSRFIQLNFFL